MKFKMVIIPHSSRAVILARGVHYGWEGQEIGFFHLDDLRSLSPDLLAERRLRSFPRRQTASRTLGDEFRNETFSGGKRFTARRANDRDILEQEHDTYKGKMTLINKRSTPDDSAVYICAINHMSKKHLEFGGGNRLTLLPETQAVASAYLHKVDTDGPTACMVKESGPAVASVLLSGETVSAEPTMATGESSYGLVAVATHSASDCRVKQGNVEVFTSEEENQSGMNTDEKMNFLYLSLLGLRVLCVKTLVLSGLLTISLLNFST